jgi:hypothetical protein
MTRRGRCYECTLNQDGRKRTELHHPFGRHNHAVASVALEIPGNWHRAFDFRRAKRAEILMRPGDNPLQQIAAVVTTLGEAADAFADYARRQQWSEWTASLAELFAIAANSAATWLLVLAGRLDDRLGPAWHWDLDLPPWNM